MMCSIVVWASTPGMRLMGAEGLSQDWFQKWLPAVAKAVVRLFLAGTTLLEGFWGQTEA